MDVQRISGEAPFFSILNDNKSPSFAIRPKQSSPAPTRSSDSTSASPSPRLGRQARPSLLRQDHYTRTSSFSSAGSPPLLRLSSNSSMDSSPSPLTPAYSYNDNTILPFEPMLRQDMAGYLQSPTTVTPFFEQQLLIAPPAMPDHFSSKSLPPTLLPNQYPIAPAPINPSIQHIPKPTSVNSSVPPPGTVPATVTAPAPVHIQSKTSPTAASTPATGKKNKYPCPYAQSHSCTATFTTSGHAARHGKKHTGEKGVHCPVCNKAFTRKDNMKQHERTHKGPNSGSKSDDSTGRRSKAAITKDAQKTKQLKKTETVNAENSRRSSLIRSPLSEATSLAPPTTETSMNSEDSLGNAFYPEAPQMLLPIQVIPEAVSPGTLYPPISEELLNTQPSLLPLPQMMLDKPVDFGLNGTMPMVQGLRYTDLDTLAQAAESFDPYYAPPPHM